MKLKSVRSALTMPRLKKGASNQFVLLLMRRASIIGDKMLFMIYILPEICTNFLSCCVLRRYAIVEKEKTNFTVFYFS